MENKFIKIYDDILPLKLIDEVKNTVLSSSLPYYYNSDINTTLKTSQFSPGFAHQFYKENSILSNWYSLFINVLYNFCYSQSIIPIKVLNGRVFLQLPLSFNPPQDIHIDNTQPHWVCLYYINDSEGDTIFYDDYEKEITRASPKKGRIVFFDGSIKHSAGIPNKTNRAILNFNFQGYKFGKEKEN